MDIGNDRTLHIVVMRLRCVVAAKETDLKESLKESPPKLYNRNTANSININVSRSPPNNNPSPTPMSSPEGSPLEDKTNVQTKKVITVHLN